MDLRDFGLTALKVSALGLGTGRLGRAEVSERDAERLLHGALELGVTLIDTARSYGLAEERIGRYLSQRRSSFILSTKVGYGIPGIPDLTYDAVIAGVKEALHLLRTDYLDIVHLHSFSAQTVRDNGLFDALQAMASQGLVRVPAYSGDNDDLTFAVGSGRIRSMMCSFNVCDQRVLNRTLPAAKEKGLGVLAKRPLANAPWRHAERPTGSYGEVYWDRWKAMHIATAIEPEALFLRFAAYTWGVDAVVTGVSSVEHLEKNIRAIEGGPLPQETVDEIRRRFQECDDGWSAEV